MAAAGAALALPVAGVAGIALVGFLKAATFNLYVDPLGALAGACQSARQ